MGLYRMTPIYFLPLLLIGCGLVDGRVAPVDSSDNENFLRVKRNHEDFLPIDHRRLLDLPNTEGHLDRVKRSDPCANHGGTMMRTSSPLGETFDCTDGTRIETTNG